MFKSFLKIRSDMWNKTAQDPPRSGSWVHMKATQGCVRFWQLHHLLSHMNLLLSQTPNKSFSSAALSLSHSCIRRAMFLEFRVIRNLFISGKCQEKINANKQLTLFTNTYVTSVRIRCRETLPLSPAISLASPPAPTAHFFAVWPHTTCYLSSLVCQCG